MTPRVDLVEVRAVARGRWLDLLPRIEPRLRDAVQRHPHHTACPFHGGRDGFRFFKDAPETGGAICATCGSFPSGFDVLMWLTGHTFPETLTVVADALAMVGGNGDGATPPPSPSTAGRHWTREKLEALWHKAQSDPGRIAEYFRHRGLSGAVPPTLRFDPSHAYFEETPTGPQHVGDFPAILLRVDTVDRELVALHRIFLDPSGSGKADVASPKKLTPTIREGALRGAAIRLAPAGDTLAVAEGLETALAVLEATGLPTWATVSAWGMENFVVPAGVQRRLYIFGDHDESGRGQQAAEQLAARAIAGGLTVYLLIPPEPDTDWLNVLVDAGPDIIRALMRGAKPWQAPSTRPKTGDDRRPLFPAEPTDLKILLPEVQAAIETWNTRTDAGSPYIYNIAGVPSRLEWAPAGEPVLVPIQKEHVLWLLAESARWDRPGRSKKAGRVNAIPPRHVIDAVRALPAAAWPFLQRFRSAPYFRRDGSLVLRPGYDAAAGFYYVEQPGLNVPPVGESPSAAEVAEATAFLVKDLLGDFCFREDADRANAFGIMLTPFAQPFYSGHTPATAISKSVERAGAGLLVDTVLWPALGRRLRVCLTELVPEMEYPEQRDGFRHGDLRGFITRSRGRAIWACCTLIRATIAAGWPQPTDRPIIGDFQGWADTLASLLTVAGVAGFMGNRARVRALDPVGDAWRVLVRRWREEFGVREVTAGMLWPLTGWKRDEPRAGYPDPAPDLRPRPLGHVDVPLPLELRDGTEKSQQTQFGIQLSKQTKRIFDGWRVVYIGDTHNAKTYRLVSVSADPPWVTDPGRGDDAGGRTDA